MPPYALALIILSTFMHAGWNLLVRQTRSELFFVRRMLIVGSVVGLVPALFCELFAESMGIKTFGIVLCSGVCCGVYFLGLAKGYRASDFTIVYPLARAVPVLLLGVTDIMMDQPPTILGWLGMALVVIGCFFAPLTSIRDFRWGHYFNWSMFWILLAALGTIGYSLIDKHGAQHIHEHVKPGWSTALRYSYYFFLIATVTYMFLLRVTRTDQSQRGAIGWGLPTIASAMNIVSYALIVWVFQMTQQVSYVVAFRQFSIVIGVLAAFALFHEPGKFVRTVSTLLLTMGLVVISIWG